MGVKAGYSNISDMLMSHCNLEVRRREVTLGVTVKLSKSCYVQAWLVKFFLRQLYLASGFSRNTFCCTRNENIFRRFELYSSARISMKALYRTRKHATSAPSILPSHAIHGVDRAVLKQSSRRCSKESERGGKRAGFENRTENFLSRRKYMIRSEELLPRMVRGRAMQKMKTKKRIGDVY